MIAGLFHLALRTGNLPRTVHFYEQVLGLREVPRPPNIKFPGAWLALPNPPFDAIIHVYAGIAAVGEGETLPKDNLASAVDHLSLLATGFVAQVAELERLHISWRAQNTNPTNLQLFVHDPNGLKLELTFNPANETGTPIVLTEGQKYLANERFFQIAEYVQFD
jgi:catechol 2,3-dioxygenase-like lactoylglutathione lyase family enzyme